MNEKQSISRFLEECESEQLHLSGMIQPHGTLIAADSAMAIAHMAANFNEFTGQSFDLRPGNPLPDEFAKFLRHLALAPGERDYRWLRLGDRNFRTTTHINDDGCLVLELSRAVEKVGTYVAREAVMPTTETQFKAEVERITRHVAELSGFQRVMYYEFREDGDGEVVFEVCDADVYGSFFGLRFPASDIPQIARDLYVKNPWRLIADVNAEPIEIVSRDFERIDLTYSDLRSVSPVHTAYLRNMSVQTSLSFPIVVTGRLHGLIACHHRDAVIPDTGRMEFISHEVRSHSLSVAAFFASRKMLIIEEFSKSFSLSVQSILEDMSNVADCWEPLGEWILKEFNCNGVQLAIGSSVFQFGSVPDDEVLALIESLKEQCGLTVIETNSIRRSIAALPHTDICGVLAFDFVDAKHQKCSMFLYREEYIHEVQWGGNPEKPVEKMHDGVVLSPRLSFEKWVEKRLGFSREWTRTELLKAGRLKALLSRTRLIV